MNKIEDFNVGDFAIYDDCLFEVTKHSPRTIDDLATINLVLWNSMQRYSGIDYYDVEETDHLFQNLEKLSKKEGLEHRINLYQKEIEALSDLQYELKQDLEKENL